MLNPSSTEDTSIPHESTRDPWSLLVGQLQDLILTALADGYGLSPADLPSLYLTKSVYVRGEKRDGQYSMLFDLHVKEQDQASDVATLSLKFAVSQIKVIESC